MGGLIHFYLRNRILYYRFFSRNPYRYLQEWAWWWAWSTFGTADGNIYIANSGGGNNVARIVYD
jgi:hypothetical protein